VSWWGLSRRPQRGHDVRALDAVPLEGLELHFLEAGLPQLRRHVRGGGLVAGRAPGMRAEGGEGRRVAEGGLAVDRGGEEKAEKSAHSGA
jgi:hypothetical protein